MNALAIAVLPISAFVVGSGFFASPLRAQDEDPRPVQSEDAKKLEKLADEVAGEVEELRERKFLRPVKRGVYSEAQLRGFLQKKLFEKEYADGRLERHQWFLTELGFFPAGTDFAKTYVDVLLSQIGGFYDPEQNSFFMLEKAAKYGDFINRMMIAHELTHALDDQHYALQRRMDTARTHDGGFALGAVVEGSATALMYRWSAKNRESMDLAQMKAAQKREMESAKTLIGAPAYFHVLVANYMAGSSFVAKGAGVLQITMHGSFDDEVRQCFEKPPSSGEQILHPDKYWKEETRDLPVALANREEFEAALTGACEATIIERDRMGEVYMAILTRDPERKLNMQLMTNARYWTTKAATGWDGDELFVLERPSETTPDDRKERGIVWLTVWDSDEDRQEFEEAYARHYSERVRAIHWSEGKQLAYAFGFARSLGTDGLKNLAQKAKFE
ncbi:MAG: hypothetical protein H6832_13480 [Planctomycetes bacterium]|nr:hypothetical protein [Planctomycetota bacterium]MCB9919408.1 hypothetical protein [Planctomycetota bacterium]